MAEQHKQLAVLDHEEWKWWRKTIVALLRRLWRLKGMIEAVSPRYYDGSPILFDGQERDLNECIASAELLAQVYNTSICRGSTLPPINLAVHRRSAEGEAADAVCELVSQMKAICC